MKFSDRLTEVLNNDEYLCGHLGQGNHQGLLYYTLSNLQNPKVCVCLGSGNGSVPSLIREGQAFSGNSLGKTFLVDAQIEGWGQGNIHDAQGIFRKNFPEIEVLKMTTDNSCEYFKKNLSEKIDYLHIDADHSYEQSFKDFENFYKIYSLMADNFIITMHDTAIDFLDNMADGCVGRAISEIRSKYKQLEIIDFNAPVTIPNGLFTQGNTGKYAAGTCIIKPRIYNKFDQI